jgi:hypothetical protein
MSRIVIVVLLCHRQKPIDVRNDRRDMNEETHCCLYQTQFHAPRRGTKGRLEASDSWHEINLFIVEQFVVLN